VLRRTIGRDARFSIAQFEKLNDWQRLRDDSFIACDGLSRIVSD
jgi:hypothetical protein